MPLNAAQAQVNLRKQKSAPRNSSQRVMNNQNQQTNNKRHKRLELKITTIKKNTDKHNDITKNVRPSKTKAKNHYTNTKQNQWTQGLRGRFQMSS